MQLRSLAMIVLATAVLSGQRFGQISSTGQIEPSYTSQQATQAEHYLEGHPEDRTVVQRLLDYYVQHWQDTQPDRLRLVLWTIEHHPNVDLEGVHDSRGLLLNPDDQEGYQRARQLWLEQLRLHPDEPRILENAATCLRLSDRESAEDWLKQ